MKKIYEAIGEEKRRIIDINNEYMAFQRQLYQKDHIGVADLIMVGRTNKFPFDSLVDTHWSLNGLLIDSKTDYSHLGEIIVIEPLEKQIDIGKLSNISEVDTWFQEPIKLSNRATILMPLKKYDELRRYLESKNKTKNIRLYEGDADLAVKMLFFDKGYIYLDVTKNGYSVSLDAREYTMILLERQKQLAEEMQEKGKNVTYREISDFYDTQNRQEISEEKILLQPQNVEQGNAASKKSNFKMITGLTEEVEGDTHLGDELFASTDIGKIRENQEDAVLLIKDEEIPEFKMMVVADGMGGWQNGEIASNVIVNKLKEWFQGFSKEEKRYYYINTIELKESLQEKIEKDMQIEVEYQTGYLGGTTLVCAVIGLKNTLIANIGDSRAYIIKDGKLKQISREDTVAQKNLEKGKTPTKEASRFDEEANQLIQCIGMDRRDLNHPHFEILDNHEYDMMLLFSDGITDCLSDDDIAVVCKNSNRKEVAKQLVEKAIKHDSIEPEELLDYEHLNIYIPGGKDNATAAVYAPERDE